MATTKTSETAKSNPTPNPSTERQNGSTPEESRSDDWVRFGEERPMFKPAKLPGEVLEGFVIDREEFLDKKRNKKWYGLIVRATKTFKAIDRQGKTVDVTPGKDCILPETYDLRKVASLVRDDVCYRVRIAPAEKIEIGGGNTMWTYDKDVNKRPTVRSQVAPPRMGGMGGKVLELEAGDDADDTAFDFGANAQR